MPKTYYDSELTAAEIESVLTAIDGVVNPGNNGKVLYIEGGQIKAASASRWSGGYPEPTGTINISANGLVNVKDYAEANVQVPGGGSNIEVIPLSVTANGTYTAPAGKAYSPVTVNVSGGGGGGLSASVGELFRHIMFSNSANDRVSRSDRYFQRNTNEPVLFLCGAYYNGSTIAYTGYAAISFSSSGVTGTYSSYGDLTGVVEKTTPSGTTYYVQIMNGMYPISTDSNLVKFRYNSFNNNYLLSYVFDSSSIFVNGGDKEFVGSQTLIDSMYSMIDAMYQEYYAS